MNRSVTVLFSKEDFVGPRALLFLFGMATNEVWRRVVFIRWKEKATRGEVARAMNVHKSFPRAIPCVISVAEGMTCTSMVDGGGCYPGVGLDQQNRKCELFCGSFLFFFLLLRRGIFLTNFLSLLPHGPGISFRRALPPIMITTTLHICY